MLFNFTKLFLKSITENYKLSRSLLYIDPHDEQPAIKTNVIPWDNSKKIWCNSEQYSSGWGSSTSTLCVTDSSSSWSTNEQSFSLVTNEDGSTFSRVY